MTEPLRILSLGAGVQSSTVLLMSIVGVLPRLHAAIFADTGWEPAAVYAHLERLEGVASDVGIPIFRVSGGNLRDETLDPGVRSAPMPFYLTNPDGTGRGFTRRTCTKEYKVQPVRRKVRALSSGGKRPVEQWFGISLDEHHRMRTSDVGYITHQYPLVERRMTRHDCQRWLEAHAWRDVPRSACIGCPFHNNTRWRHIRDTAPDEWADAVAFDKAIRADTDDRWLSALRGVPYLHQDRVPLEQVDLSTPEDHGQLNLFVNECEGMCGV